MNTDSALIDSSNLEKLRHIIGPNPGQLKIEHTFDEILIAGKNLFQGRLKGEVIKTCASGVAASDVFNDGATLESNPKEFFYILFNTGQITLTSKHLRNNMKEGQLLHKVYNKVITLQGYVAANTLLTSDGETPPDDFVLFDDEDTKEPCL